MDVGVDCTKSFPRFFAVGNHSLMSINILLNDYKLTVKCKYAVGFSIFL
jgi:hypothetical protein